MKRSTKARIRGFGCIIVPVMVGFSCGGYWVVKATSNHPEWGVVGVIVGSLGAFLVLSLMFPKGDSMGVPTASLDEGE